MTAPQVCPRCRGTVFMPTGPQSVRCAGCQLPIAMRSTGSGSSWIAPVVIGVVILALAIGGVIAYALIGYQKQRSRALRDRLDTYDRMAREESEARRRARDEAEPDRAPPIAVLGKAMMGNKNTAFWLVPYTNAGETPIGAPAVIVTTFDKRGERLAEEIGFGRLHRVEPGETTIILVMAKSPGEVARFEVEPREPRPASWEPKPAVARVTEWRVEHPEYGLPRIVGFVANEGKETMKFVSVQAVGKNAAGEVVSYANGYSNESTLRPGESSGFDLTAGVWEVETPASWELAAHGTL